MRIPAWKDFFIARLWEQGALLQAGTGRQPTRPCSGDAEGSRGQAQHQGVGWSCFASAPSAQGLGLALHLMVMRLLVWSHTSFFPPPCHHTALAGKDLGWSQRCGPAGSCWHFACMRNSTGHHPGCCTRELEELPPPNQRSPCVRVCRMLLNHVWVSEVSGLEFRGNRAQ